MNPAIIKIDFDLIEKIFGFRPSAVNVDPRAQKIVFTALFEDAPETKPGCLLPEAEITTSYKFEMDALGRLKHWETKQDIKFL